VGRFGERVAALPRLGLGLSTEHGAGAVGVDPIALRDEDPAVDGFPEFLEIGADVARGLDADARRWIARGWPTTYHFLDVNLEEPEDLDADWIDATAAAAREAGAAWLCGDAGLWHVGPRDRGHGTLLPPILCADSVRAMAEAVVALREATGFEVLPENPPAQVLLGDLHPLEYFGALAERADCGLLLDLSHLAIVQRALGLRPDALLDAFPVERVVEVHLAGGRQFEAGGRLLIDDDHGPEVVDEAWALLEAVVKRAVSLRAVVVECERNPAPVVRRLAARVRQVLGEPATAPRTPAPIELSGPSGVDHRRAQRLLFRMALDPSFAAAISSGAEPTGLTEPADGWLRRVDVGLLAADPGGRRRDQLLGNVATEFLHTVRAAPGVLDGFVGSPSFHAAIERGRPLPLAFADHAAEVLPEGPARALLALDAALAEARRVDRPSADPPSGGGALALAPGARLLSLPEGTLAAAEALAAGRAARAPDPSRAERVVVGAKGPPGPDRPVHVELVSDGIAALLEACPLDRAGVEAFAAAHDVEVDELLALADGLRADGVIGG
jgi:uncharacterized protein